MFGYSMKSWTTSKHHLMACMEMEQAWFCLEMQALWKCSMISFQESDHITKKHLSREKQNSKQQNNIMQRYSKLLENIKNNTVFKKEKDELWICRNCGYIIKGASAPELCPCCKHPHSYFQILCEQF